MSSLKFCEDKIFSGDEDMFKNSMHQKNCKDALLITDVITGEISCGNCGAVLCEKAIDLGIQMYYMDAEEQELLESENKGNEIKLNDKETVNYILNTYISPIRMELDKEDRTDMVELVDNFRDFAKGTKYHDDVWNLTGLMSRQNVPGLNDLVDLYLKKINAVVENNIDDQIKYQRKIDDFIKKNKL